MVVCALLGVPVSAGFVARADERLARDLAAAGFDEAMKAALRAEAVLCGDESPVNVLRRILDEATGTVPSGSPHLLVVRTPTPGLMWYAAISSHSSEAIEATGVLAGWHGYLTRDDYAGWHQYDDQLAGVQLCCQHIIRSPLLPLPLQRAARRPLLGLAGELGKADAGLRQLPPQLGVVAGAGGGLDGGEPGGPGAGGALLGRHSEDFGEDALGGAVGGDAPVFPAPDFLSFGGHADALGTGAGGDEAGELLVAPAAGGPDLGQGVAVRVGSRRVRRAGDGHAVTTTTALRAVRWARMAVRTLSAGERWSAVGTSTRALSYSFRLLMRMSRPGRRRLPGMMRRST